VDEYLSEREQVERIREWWRENGWFLVGGVALGALALFGWHQYQKHRDTVSVQAEALYVQVRDAIGDNDRAGAAKLVDELRDDYASSPYTDQAGLALAGAYLVSNTDKAADELRYVMEHTDDQELGIIARLRLARLLIYQMKEQDALNLLAVDDPGQFAAQIDEIRGDAYVALGDNDAARTAYSSALTAPGADWLNRNFLEMKLGALGPDEAAAPNAGNGAADAAAASNPAAGTAGSAGSAAGGTAAPAGGASAGDAPASGDREAAPAANDAPAPAGDASAPAGGGAAPAAGGSSAREAGE
jgi:predicted negative regulator of RcsB-dependent stress response